MHKMASTIIDDHLQLGLAVYSLVES